MTSAAPAGAGSCSPEDKLLAEVVKGGKGSKDSIMKLWTQKTTNILKKLAVAADKAGD